MWEASAEDREYSDGGVDLTLIRWMLSLTPEERLQVVEAYANEGERCRRS
jgi:hypothetical protein